MKDETPLESLPTGDPQTGEPTLNGKKIKVEPKKLKNPKVEEVVEEDIPVEIKKSKK